MSRFDIIELMMTPSFWIGVATVVFVTLLVYWLLTRLIAFVKKGITTRGDKHPSTNRMRFILTDMLNRTSRVLLLSWHCCSACVSSTYRIISLVP